MSNFYALPTPSCPLSRLFCFGDVPTRVCVSVTQCSNQKTSRLCLCRSYNQIVCYPVHDSYVVIPPHHSLALISRIYISKLLYKLRQHSVVLISHNPSCQQYHTRLSTMRCSLYPLNFSQRFLSYVHDWVVSYVIFEIPSGTEPRLKDLVFCSIKCAPQKASFLFHYFWQFSFAHSHPSSHVYKLTVAVSSVIITIFPHPHPTPPPPHRLRWHKGSNTKIIRMISKISNYVIKDTSINDEMLV